MWVNNEHNLKVMTIFLTSRLSASGLGIQSILTTPQILKYIPAESQPPPSPTPDTMLKLPPPQQDITLLPK
jgi:hypothetical protein